MNTRTAASLILCLLTTIFTTSMPVFAECNNPDMKTVMMKNINWHSMFPMYFAGAVMTPSQDTTIDINDTIGGTGSTCTCGTPMSRVGIPYGMWEPARLIERVHDPYCMYAFNTDMSSSYKKPKSATKLPSGVATGTQSNFSHAHYYLFPAMSILEVGMDIACLEVAGIDVGYMTEVDPLWEKDTLSVIIQPEALLFANVFAQVACLPSTITDNLGFAWPGRWFFWCQGSAGGIYPLTGNHQHDHLTDVTTGTIGKLLFKLTRQAMIWDPAVYICFAVPTMTWLKDHYKVHISEYFQAPITSTLGRSSIINGFFQNIPRQQNYVFVIFRKRMCCAL